MGMGMALPLLDRPLGVVTISSALSVLSHHSDHSTTIEVRCPHQQYNC
jgi:hypothetical protein